jgi:MscS family membrane protein
MTILEHLPAVLRAPGPQGLVRWQWLALPAAIVVAWVVGLFLGRLTRLLLGLLARRTSTSWDDKVVASVRGPLTLAWAVAAARVELPGLLLPERWDGHINQGLRTALYVAFFWFLLRLVTIAGTLMEASTWALARPASRSLVPLGARILQVTVLAISVVAVLGDLGFSIAGLVTGLGIGGLALALAAQKTVENLFGAFSIGVDQPFRVGDYVTVEGVQGTVEIIGLRSTRIRTLERTIVTIPNGKLADMRIESFAPRDRIRFATVLNLSRATTAAQLRHVLEGAERVLRAQPKLWPDALTVRFKEITATSLDLEVQAWFATTDFAEFTGFRQELLLAFLGVVEGAGTSFALPTRAVLVQDRTGILTGPSKGPGPPATGSGGQSPPTPTRI